MRQELFLSPWLRHRVGARWKQVQNLSLQVGNSTLSQLGCRGVELGRMRSCPVDPWMLTSLAHCWALSSKLGEHWMHQLLSP